MTRALYIVDESDRAEQDDSVLQEFVDRAGGVDALILVCGLASDDRSAKEADYIDRFTGLGARATHLHTDHPEQLEKATAVWFTDGEDQSEGDHSDDLGDDLRAEIRRRNDDGLLLGGTGAAVACGSGID